MSTSIVPTLIDALVTASTSALPAVTVIDGMSITNNPGTYLQIGVTDPDAEAFTDAADSSESVATMGTSRSRDERGSVYCVVEAWDGANNMKTARDAAYAVTAAVATLIRERTDPTLDLAGLLTLDFATDSQKLTQGQFTLGAVARVGFTVNYRARL